MEEILTKKPMSEFKVWDTFINTNGHLSLVKFKGENITCVINYNGSIYDIKLNSTHRYRPCSTSAEEFFENYPKDRLILTADKQIFDSIVATYKESHPKQNLLLIV